MTIMPIKCKKCGYERKETDTDPDYQCPGCGGIYAKIEAHLRKKAEADIAQRIEQDRARSEETRRIKELSVINPSKDNPVKKVERVKDPIITHRFTGSKQWASSQFEQHASKMAAQGYFTTSQTWMPGSYGCGAFILALLLCWVLIGIIPLIYMLLVKPKGTLLVTYQLKD